MATERQGRGSGRQRLILQMAAAGQRTTLIPFFLFCSVSAEKRTRFPTRRCHNLLLFLRV